MKLQRTDRNVWRRALMLGSLTLAATAGAQAPSGSAGVNLTVQQYLNSAFDAPAIVASPSNVLRRTQTIRLLTNVNATLTVAKSTNLTYPPGYVFGSSQSGIVGETATTTLTTAAPESAIVPHPSNWVLQVAPNAYLPPSHAIYLTVEIPKKSYSNQTFLDGQIVVQFVPSS
jgi:hypothetical protein